MPAPRKQKPKVLIEKSLLFEAEGKPYVFDKPLHLEMASIRSKPRLPRSRRVETVLPYLRGRLSRTEGKHHYYEKMDEEERKRIIKVLSTMRFLPFP